MRTPRCYGKKGREGQWVKGKTLRIRTLKDQKEELLKKAEKLLEKDYKASEAICIECEPKRVSNS